MLREIFSFLKSRDSFLSTKIISKILAILGLVAITFTGMLGGVMVYGLSTDPLAPIILKILGIIL